MENNRYVYKCGKKLRTGYTTGACAAAAAKGAVSMLFSRKKIDQVEIDTPKGWKLTLGIKEPCLENYSARCHVIKDAGDDPDITNGIEVHAIARKIETGIIITGGKGIGTVTRPGLQVPPGLPAINPAPRQMIIHEVKKVLPHGCGVEVEISIPQGEEIAHKTFNPKLGIVGGISVLGTTGIVEPMSEDALKDTIALELGFRYAAGKNTAVLVPGSYGERFCQRWFGIEQDDIVKISNYLGFALEKCSELGFKKLILAGHLGKLVKPAGGIFYTHSRVSDTRMEILTAFLAVMGMSTEYLRQIMACNTTEEAIKLIYQTGFQEVFQVIAGKCVQKCQDYVYGSMEIGVILFSMSQVLAKSAGVDRILEEMNYA